MKIYFLSRWYSICQELVSDHSSLNSYYYWIKKEISNMSSIVEGRNSSILKQYSKESYRQSCSNSQLQPSPTTYWIHQVSKLFSSLLSFSLVNCLTWVLWENELESPKEASNNPPINHLDILNISEIDLQTVILTHLWATNLIVESNQNIWFHPWRWSRQ